MLARWAPFAWQNAPKVKFSLVVGVGNVSQWPRWMIHKREDHWQGESDSQITPCVRTSIRVAHLLGRNVIFHSRHQAMLEPYICRSLSANAYLVIQPFLFAETVKNSENRTEHCSKRIRESMLRPFCSSSSDYIQYGGQSKRVGSITVSLCMTSCQKWGNNNSELPFVTVLSLWFPTNKVPNIQCNFRL